MRLWWKRIRDLYRTTQVVEPRRMDYRPRRKSRRRNQQLERQEYLFRLADQGRRRRRFRG